SWLGLLLKSCEGSRHPVSPRKEPYSEFRRFDWMPADLDVIHQLLGRCLHRKDRYEDAALRFGLERNAAVDECKQRVVAAHAAVFARMPLGATLAQDDVAGRDLLAAEHLHPEALAGRIAPVARGSACFLVGHLETPSLLSF